MNVVSIDLVDMDSDNETTANIDQEVIINNHTTWESTTSNNNCDNMEEV